MISKAISWIIALAVILGLYYLYDRYFVQVLSIASNLSQEQLPEIEVQGMGIQSFYPDGKLRFNLWGKEARVNEKERVTRIKQVNLIIYDEEIEGQQNISILARNGSYVDAKPDYFQLEGDVHCNIRIDQKEIEELDTSTFNSDPKKPSDSAEELFIKAEKARVNGQLDAAWKTFAIIENKYPASKLADNAISRLGMIAQKKGDFKLAQQLFDRLFQEYPDSDSLNNLTHNEQVVSASLSSKVYKTNHEKNSASDPILPELIRKLFTHKLRYYPALNKFVSPGSFKMVDPISKSTIRGKSLIYKGNEQIAEIEGHRTVSNDEPDVIEIEMKDFKDD